MVRFYTLPPWGVSYPYILINARRPEDGIKYLVTYGHARDVEAIIVDSGIELFRDPRVKDYPGGYRIHARRQVALYEKIRAIAPHAEIYVCVPDYCDDYHPGNLWINEEITNIERTIDSIEYAIEKFKDIPWLIPIQGHSHKPRSVLRALEQMYKYCFPFEKYNYYAVANVCVEPRCNIIEFAVKYVYGWFKDTLGYIPRIHVFGPKLKCLRKIKDYIFSFDSMAWTRPVELGLHKQYPWSAKNSQQRELFFKKYLQHLAKVIR